MYEKLKGKWAITLGKDKFAEFCEKLGIYESDTENPQYAFYVKWKMEIGNKLWSLSSVLIAVTPLGFGKELS